MAVTLEFDKVRAILESYPTKVEGTVDSYRHKKEQILSLLQDVQAEFNYLPRDVLIMISQKLNIPLSRVFSLATFFKAFSIKPRGRHMVTVCCGTACHVRESQRLVDKMTRDYKVKPGDMTADSRFSFETANCLGCCALGPVVVVDGKYQSQMNPERLGRVLQQYE